MEINAPSNKYTQLKNLFLVLASFLALLLFKKPLEYWLNALNGEERFNHFLSGSFVRAAIVIMAIVAIRRLNLTSINSLSTPLKLRNAQAFLLPLVIVGAAMWSNLDIYGGTEISLLTIFLMSAFLIGFAEELVFRGTIFPLFIKISKGRSGVVLAAIGSSALFGLVHFINLFRQPENFVGVTSQVIFAFCIGIFFSGLFLRTGNIIPVAMLHSFVNLGFGSGELTMQNFSDATEKSANAPDLASVVGTLLIFTFIAVSGLVMLHFSDKESALEKLSRPLS